MWCLSPLPRVHRLWQEEVEGRGSVKMAWGENVGVEREIQEAEGEDWEEVSPGLGYTHSGPRLLPLDPLPQFADGYVWSSPRRQAHGNTPWPIVETYLRLRFQIVKQTWINSVICTYTTGTTSFLRSKNCTCSLSPELIATKHLKKWYASNSPFFCLLLTDKVRAK